MLSSESDTTRLLSSFLLMRVSWGVMAQVTGKEAVSVASANSMKERFGFDPKPAATPAPAYIAVPQGHNLYRLEAVPPQEVEAPVGTPAPSFAAVPPVPDFYRMQPVSPLLPRAPVAPVAAAPAASAAPAAPVQVQCLARPLCILPPCHAIPAVALTWIRVC